MSRPSDPAEHWQSVYHRTAPHQVSWYQAEPAMSLRLVESAGPGRSVIDVGAGASTLVDALLERGYTDVTVLDVAPSALEAARQRVGARAGAAHWMNRNLLTWAPLRHYDVWHDRAVFHFLTDPADRDRYRRVVDAAVAPGGHIVIGVFSEAGPETCSGLPVARFNQDSLAVQFPGFQVAQVEREHHYTPAGELQPFLWLRLIRTPGTSPSDWRPEPAPRPGRLY
ncbi:methyltransferase [Catellatospora sp. NPDC049111]|uniref:class I SAM-dependent methyltransferase n=1 Tax=Catellatospora sp. NPDC049111 TaxID=3155271 RepID=UPI0033C0EC66